MKTEVGDWDLLIPPIKELVGGGLSLWESVSESLFYFRSFRFVNELTR